MFEDFCESSQPWPPYYVCIYQVCTVCTSLDFNVCFSFSFFFFFFFYIWVSSLLQGKIVCKQIRLQKNRRKWGNPTDKYANKTFLTFPTDFWIPEKFFNFNSNLLDMRNLKEKVKKAFCYQNLSWPSPVWMNCSNDLNFFFFQIFDLQPRISNVFLNQ